MPLDPALVGHETTPETATIQAEDIRQFADAIGDTNPVFHDPGAAQRAGFHGVPATPTFITRFRVPFAEAGLDTERSQVLHGEQEYAFSRPIVAGDTLVVRHRVKSIRQTARAGGMAIMTLEQFCDTPDGERVATGGATVVVRDAPTPDEAPAAGAAGSGGGKASGGKSGEPLPALTKHVTQAQIDAYANVSGDHNPIHLDQQAARAVGLDGTIAHGMLGMAFAGQLLTDWLTSSSGGWVARLRVRFQGLVRPGDTLTVRGALGDGATRQRVDVWIENQTGERVISGDAEVVRSGA